MTKRTAVGWWGLTTIFSLAVAPAWAEPRPKCLGHRVTIQGTPEGETIRGTSGDDVIQAGDGNDAVYGGKGDDIICGGGNHRVYGIDVVYGDAGNDRLFGGNDGHDDRMHGGRGADVLLAGCGWEEGQLLDGGEGDDRLMGTPCSGADLEPGPGDDVLVTSRDWLRFNDAKRGLYVNLHKGFARGEGRDRIVIDREAYSEAPWAQLSVDGSMHDDVIVGTNRADALDGGQGKDVVRGLGGDDGFNGSLDPDKLFGGAGNDDFYLQAGMEAWGGPGRDAARCLFAGDGSASFTGGAGADALKFAYLTQARADLRRGTASCSYTRTSSTVPVTTTLSLSIANVENVFAALGTQLTAFGSSERNVLIGSGGQDVIRGRAGDDVIRGKANIDSLSGDAGDDVVEGGGNDDTLHGGDDDDTLDGGEDIDAADGGDGTDHCTAEFKTNCENLRSR